MAYHGAERVPIFDVCVRLKQVKPDIIPHTSGRRAKQQKRKFVMAITVATTGVCDIEHRGSGLHWMETSYDSTHPCGEFTR
jgi:hypothetical protein